VYKEWRKIDGSWYPMQVESFLNQRHLRTIKVANIYADVVISGELMSIDHIRSTLAMPEPSTPEDESTGDAVDEVEQTIEEFKKKFEP
jgi:hypothetical protein